LVAKTLVANVCDQSPLVVKTLVAKF